MTCMSVQSSLPTCTSQTSSLFVAPLGCCSDRLTGYGIHHCFARSMMDPEARPTALCHADYYTMAGIAVATCLALCPAVGLMGRRGGLLTFMIITALASLLQLGLLNRELSHEWLHLGYNRAERKRKRFDGKRLLDLPRTITQVVYNKEKTNQLHRHLPISTFTYSQFTNDRRFTLFSSNFPISYLFLLHLLSKEEDWNGGAASTYCFFSRWLVNVKGSVSASS